MKKILGTKTNFSCWSVSLEVTHDSQTGRTGFDCAYSGRVSNFQSCTFVNIKAYDTLALLFVKQNKIKITNIGNKRFVVYKPYFLNTWHLRKQGDFVLFTLTAVKNNACEQQ